MTKIEVTVNRKHLTGCINGLLEGNPIKLADSTRDDLLTLAGACYWAAVFKTQGMKTLKNQSEDNQIEDATTQNAVLASNSRAAWQ